MPRLAYTGMKVVVIDGAPCVNAHYLFRAAKPKASFKSWFEYRKRVHGVSGVLYPRDNYGKAVEFLTAGTAAAWLSSHRARRSPKRIIEAMMLPPEYVLLRGSRTVVQLTDLTDCKTADKAVFKKELVLRYSWGEKRINYGPDKLGRDKDKQALEESLCVCWDGQWAGGADAQ